MSVLNFMTDEDTRAIAFGPNARKPALVRKHGWENANTMAKGLLKRVETGELSEASMRDSLTAYVNKVDEESLLAYTQSEAGRAKTRDREKMYPVPLHKKRKVMAVTSHPLFSLQMDVDE